MKTPTSTAKFLKHIKIRAYKRPLYAIGFIGQFTLIIGFLLGIGLQNLRHETNNLQFELRDKKISELESKIVILSTDLSDVEKQQDNIFNYVQIMENGITTIKTLSVTRNDKALTDLLLRTLTNADKAKDRINKQKR